jgi:hypothetical protein
VRGEVEVIPDVGVKGSVEVREDVEEGSRGVSSYSGLSS